MTKQVVTRFAPSPTGYLHIGGARTALFNWLYAKHTGGRFLLRIEDTDRARSTEAATTAILDGLKWLGLEWDGEALFQFARADRHREVARLLLAEGKAYNCYLSAADLDEMRRGIEAERDLARAEKRAPRGPQTIQSPWRDRDPKEAPAGVAPAIRLRASKDGETVIEDMVAGRVVVKNSQLDDMILVRSDGAPTYNFAVVVDDHDMGVTHVIRGADHLNNASRQTQVYLACGWDVPVWAHVPLIHGADGAKLSKRHGAQGVEEYRAMGYLPIALRNYLVRLGWSHGNDEIISPEQMIEWFDIDDLGKSAARFDFAKLADLNGHYIRKSEPAEIKQRLAEALPEMENGPATKSGLDKIGWDKLDPLLPALMERAKTLKDIAAGTGLLFTTRPLKLDDKAAKVLDDAARATLKELADAFSSMPDWKPAALEAILKAYVETSGKKMGQVAQPLRVALTGSTVSPPVFDVMAAFGREESLARIMDQAGV